MKSKALTILLLTLAIGHQSCDNKLNVDNPDDFYKYIGADGNQWGIDLAVDTNGNIFILGKTDSNSDGMQIYVVMTNSHGVVQWTNTFGGPGDEEPKDIELLSDGDLILVADRTVSGTGEKDFVIYKVSGIDGSVIGTGVKGGDGNAAVPDYANSITQIKDGFIVAAYADNGAFKVGYVFRYDEALGLDLGWGANVSQLSASGGYDLVPMKVIQFDDDIFYTFGYTNTINNDAINDYNFFIYVGGSSNVSKNGLLIIPGPDVSSDERLTSVRPITPGSGTGYVLTGYVSDPTSGKQDLYVLKTPLILAEALITELKTYLTGTPKVVTSEFSSINASTASVFSSANSGFLLLGEENVSGNGDLYLTKVDKNLDDAWPGPHTSQVFGGVGNDIPGAVAEGSNGRILVVGTMIVGEVNGQAKIVLMNLSPNGMFGE